MRIFYLSSHLPFIQKGLFTVIMRFALLSVLGIAGVLVTALPIEHKEMLHSFKRSEGTFFPIPIFRPGGGTTSSSQTTTTTTTTKTGNSNASVSGVRGGKGGVGIGTVAGNGVVN